MAENGLMVSGSAMVTAARSRWVAMEPARRRVLLTCFACLLAFSGVSVWWSTRTDWRVLYSGLDGRDAAAMEQQLAGAGIAYQTTPDGASVQVAAEQLDKARVSISSGGLPQSGRLGFELFDKPNWVGSEFDERVNYQRALEGELEHTIDNLGSVRSARVHIVLPKQGAFASEDQPAKASVVLKLRRSNLPREQTDAMRNLIAGAVEGLKPEDITLVDADGRANLSATNSTGEDRDKELALQSKLISVLEPLAGVGNVHATVSLSYLQGTEEHTDEVYDPQSSTPVSMQKTEQTSQAMRGGGIAGAASNAPVAQATVNNVAPNSTPAPTVATPPVGANNSGQTQTSREENSSYAVTRHVTHTAEMPGRIQRMTAAVVVNDRVTQQMDGKTIHTVWQHRSPDEMKQLQQLAQASVGFDDKRGDQMVLENISFSGNNDILPAAGLGRFTERLADLLRSQPTLPRAIVTGLIVLLVGLFVLHPLMRQTQMLLAAPLHQNSLSPATEDITASEATIAAGDTARVASGGASLSTQHVFDRVSAQIKNEPNSSTRLIESWIGAAETD
jgi:flagellar M-ring protein FliF